MKICLMSVTLMIRFLLKGKYLVMMVMLMNFILYLHEKNGISVRRGHIYKSCTNESKKNPSGIYKREFVCHRGGIVKQRNINEAECQRKRKSSKCNCGAKMLVSIKTIGFEEKWVVTYFNNHHNHELLDDKEVQFLPAYRNIPTAD